MGTIKYWAAKDNWTDRRKHYREALRDRIAAQVGDKLTQARISQLQSLEEIFQIGINKLKTQLVDANSWEGVANAITKLSVFIDDQREKLAGQVSNPLQGQAQIPSSVRPKLTEDEAREAAALIIRKRRDEMRKKIVEAQQEEGETPALKVLPGKTAE